MVMNKQKRCEHCRKSILPKEHQVYLITKKERKVMEEVNFHITCWAEYFNKAVTNRAKENVSFMQEKVKGIFKNPMLKGFLSQVQGSDCLMGMLNMDLNKTVDQFDLDKSLESIGAKPRWKVTKKSVKKENGKPKKRKRKTKMSKV